MHGVASGTDAGCTPTGIIFAIAAVEMSPRRRQRCIISHSALVYAESVLNGCVR